MGPSAGRRVPCLYTTLASPQPGTPSAYSLKSYGTGVPERERKKTYILHHTTLNEENLSDIIYAHPTKLIHWLVVESRTNDVKRRHADGHSDSTDRGSYQSIEPAVWTKPLWEKTDGVMTTVPFHAQCKM